MRRMPAILAVPAFSQEMFKLRPRGYNDDNESEVLRDVL